LKLRVTVDDKTYEVDVEAIEPESAPPSYREHTAEPAPVRIPLGPPASPPPTPAPENEEKACRSPIAGVVVRVAAQPGQSIQTGDILLVLEAMKMETNITAPMAGKVASVKVQPGESVQRGQVLVEFE